MNLLHLPSLSPAEQLAADEVLLDQCEAGQGDETLVFWVPETTFVVVGYANKVATEVNIPACEARQVPIFRRGSGGGTVVQMAGGLNYSLVLRIGVHHPTRNITSTNQFVMERNRTAIQGLVPAAEIAVRGHTDLTIRRPESGPVPLKFAGNSQRRRKDFLLFHGTLLLNCDLLRISELLRMPSLQPDYRENRSHADFVTNLQVPAEIVKAALTREWQASISSAQLPLSQIRQLARDKYSTPEWNYKF